jgi:hypothetical protein
MGDFEPSMGGSLTDLYLGGSAPNGLSRRFENGEKLLYCAQNCRQLLFHAISLFCP